MEFNLKRFSNLIRRDWIINQNYVLFALLGLFVFMFGLSHVVAYNDNQPILDADFWYGWWVAIFLGGGFIFTAMVFWEFKSHAGRIQFLSLPASNLEKSLSRLLYSGVAYPIVTLSIVALAYFLSSSFYGFSDWGHYHPKEFQIPLCFFILGHAFVFICALTFNRYVIPKSIILSFGLLLAFAFMMSLGFRIIFHEHFEGFAQMNQSIKIANGDDVNLSMGNWLLPISLVCVPVFLWVVAYFKMKEKEA